MQRKNLLLTGFPGVGKTTVVRKVLALLPPQLKFDGFFTEEVREGGERIGFQIVTVDGKRAWLAKKGLPSPHKVGKYGVDVKAIESVIIPALNKALKQADLIIVDEIAKMELCHPAFAEVVWECLESSKPVLGVIQRSQLPFIERVKAREDVRIFEVTVQNRNELPKEIVEVLDRLLKPLSD
ncbi:MAG: NTPase [Armatimonadetes bacterium]|nr:NTPase [Armatimonadota bacterium]MCX7967986.1 NTPase [Armatimonadota bacterium]MDW8142400.1 NTPase [Armatimonadota bacterium]